MALFILIFLMGLASSNVLGSDTEPLWGISGEAVDIAISDDGSVVAIVFYDSIRVYDSQGNLMWYWGGECVSHFSSVDISANGEVVAASAMVYDEEYEKGNINYQENLPFAFYRCRDLGQLCSACQMFGVINGSRVIYRGKVSFDAFYAMFLVTKVFFHFSFENLLQGIPKQAFEHLMDIINHPAIFCQFLNGFVFEVLYNIILD